MIETVNVLSFGKSTKIIFKKFFGITYNDNSESQAEKYETLRLLKILHDYIRECNVDLGYFIQKFLLSNKIESVSLENLCDFAGKYKKDLAKIVHSNITNDTELRKFSVRIDRHKDDYAVIDLVYKMLAIIFTVLREKMCP